MRSNIAKKGYSFLVVPDTQFEGLTKQSESHVLLLFQVCDCSTCQWFEDAVYRSAVLCCSIQRCNNWRPV